MLYPKNRGSGQDFVVGARTNDNDLANISHLRGDYRHDHGGKKGKAAAGYIAANRIDGPGDLCELHARFDLE